jgi:hypothetical protein
MSCEIHAYAWASLAAENGLEKAKALADRLRPDLAPGSEKIADDPGRGALGDYIASQAWRDNLLEF